MTLIQGSQTLGKPKKGKSQRHSAGNIDYDNITTVPDTDIVLHHHPHYGFRIRSRTVGDSNGWQY